MYVRFASGISFRKDRPKEVLAIDDDERARLLALTRARSLPAALTQRARIVLACERQPSNQAVASELGVSAHTVGKWRQRFITQRLAGLHDELRSGRPRTIDDAAVADLLTKTLTTQPHAGTHWSVRAMAAETGVSKSAVHRFFQLFGLQPIAPAASSCRARTHVSSAVRSCADPTIGVASRIAMPMH